MQGNMSTLPMWLLCHAITKTSLILSFRIQFHMLLYVMYDVHVELWDVLYKLDYLQDLICKVRYSGMHERVNESMFFLTMMGFRGEM